MYFNNITLYRPLEQKVSLCVKRNILCITSGNISDETYIDISRNIKYDIGDYQYISANVLISNRNTNHPYRIYGFYNTKKARFYPLYIVDPMELNIWLLVDWISICKLSKDIKFSTNSKHYVKTIIPVFISKLVPLYDDMFDQQGARYLENYLISNNMLDYLIPINVENNHMYQTDLINSFLHENMSNLSYKEFSINVDRLLLLPSSINSKMKITIILNKLNSLFQDNLCLIDRILYKNRYQSSKIMYGKIHNFDLSSEMISINRINDTIYTQLIEFIKRTICIESIWFSNRRGKFDLEGMVSSFVITDNSHDLHSVSFNLLRILLEIKKQLRLKDKITDIIKVDDFNLIFVGKNCKYHIDLMIIPLSTYLIQ